MSSDLEDVSVIDHPTSQRRKLRTDGGRRGKADRRYEKSQEQAEQARQTHHFAAGAGGVVMGGADPGAAPGVEPKSTTGADCAAALALNRAIGLAPL